MPPRHVTPKQPARDVNRAARVTRAIEMRKSGYIWEEIAQACGWGSKASAYNAVNDYLKTLMREPAEELRSLELLRLDELLRALWPQATRQMAEAAEDDEDAARGRRRQNGPDLWAVDRALAIMERRAKLLGLDIPNQQSAPAAQVVIRSYGAAGDAV